MDINHTSYGYRIHIYIYIYIHIYIHIHIHIPIIFPYLLLTSPVWMVKIHVIHKPIITPLFTTLLNEH